MERDRDAALEPRHPQSRAKIVSSASAFRKGREPLAMRQDPVDIAEGARRPGLLGDIVVDSLKIAFGLR
jgi:hypothetical protein